MWVDKVLSPLSGRSRPRHTIEAEFRNPSRPPPTDSATFVILISVLAGNDIHFRFDVKSALIRLRSGKREVLNMEEKTGLQFTIEAAPDPITLNRAQTAVIVVDMQNDFCSQGGMFHWAGVDISSVQKTIGRHAQGAVDSAQGRNQDRLPENGFSN
jgi:hypothetical protein